jgi:hypothetical protein
LKMLKLLIRIQHCSTEGSKGLMQLKLVLCRKWLQ